MTSLLVTNLMNPNNEEAFMEELSSRDYVRVLDIEVAYYWPTMLTILCFIWTSFVIFGIFAISIKREDKFLWDNLADNNSMEEF